MATSEPAKKATKADLQAQLDAERKKREELENKINQVIATQPAVQTTGEQGAKVKYNPDPSLYDDPRERLYDEKKLAKFALRENYVFKWNIETWEVDTKNGWEVQPRFIFEVYRYPTEVEKANAREAGQPIAEGAMFKEGEHVQTEDKAAARQMARKLKLTFESDKEMMDEMRYQRILQYLLGQFFPVTTIAQRKEKERVVPGSGKVMREVSKVI